MSDVVEVQNSEDFQRKERTRMDSSDHRHLATASSLGCEKGIQIVEW